MSASDAAARFKAMSVQEMAEWFDLLSTMENTFADHLDTVGYYSGGYYGYISGVDFQMIRRRTEILIRVYEDFGISVPTDIPEFSACKGPRLLFSLIDGEIDDDAMDDFYESFNEDVSDFYKGFTNVAGIGDFRELETYGGEFLPEDIPEYYSDAQSLGFLTSNVSELFIAAASEALDQSVDELGDDDLLDFLAGKDVPYDYDECIEFQTLVVIQSKKVGKVLPMIEHKPNKTEEEELFIKVFNRMYIQHANTYSSIGKNGVETGLDGEAVYTMAELYTSIPEQEEGMGVSSALRNLPLKFYAYVLQELADRILRKEAEDVKPARSS